MFQRPHFVVVFACMLMLVVARALVAQTSQPTATEALLAACEKAAEYSEAHGGCAMLVQKGGKTVFERYTRTSGPNVPHFLASGTKSFWGVVAAAAIDDKLLTLDEKVADTINEWKNDPKKSAITIRHLLSLTSGLMPGSEKLTPNAAPDLYRAALAMPAVADSGSVFRYGPTNYYVFGEVMKRKLAGKYDSPYAYLEARILKPIGLAVAAWRRDEAGNYLTPQGATLTAREWVKFGEFLKNGGKIGGKSIVSAETLGACMKGSTANPAYGLTFWLNAPGRGPAGERLPGLADPKARDLFQAAGAFGQRLIVCPSLDLVIVRFADGDRGFTELDFLAPIGRALGLGEKSATEAPTSRTASQPTSAPTSRPTLALTGTAKKTFDRFDKNGDGKIARDELNPRQARFLMRADRDKDDMLSESEFAEAWDDLRSRLENR